MSLSSLSAQGSRPSSPSPSLQSFNAFPDDDNANDIENPDSPSAATDSFLLPPTPSLSEPIGAHAFSDAAHIVPPSFALDFAAVPDTLLADDPGDQQALNLAILRSNHSASHFDQAYDDAPTFSLPLTTLRRIYKNKDKKSAISILSKKHSLHVNPDFVFDDQSKYIAWQVKEHRLDYMCRVPNAIGFNAVLPNMQNRPARNDHTWSFKMTFKHRHLAYTGDIDVLAFNPRGAMLYIGQSSSNESVWWTLFPHQALEPYPSVEHMNSDLGPSTMDPVLSRICIACLLYMMDKSMYSTVYLARTYPDVTSRESFKAHVSNALDMDPYEFSSEQLNDLQSTLENHYESWWESAPQSYRHPLLTGRTPAAVTLKYGQNREVCKPFSTQTDAKLWARECDYSKLSRVAFALATHYRASPVQSWTPIPVEEIIDRHPVIYTTPNVETRELIEDLASYPLCDDEDREICVYAPNGRRVPRQDANYHDPYEPGAILQNLRLVPDLFAAEPSHHYHWRYDEEGAIVRDYAADNADEREVDALLDGVGTPGVQLYPQGYLPYGQWQSDGVIDPLRPHISAISHSLKAHDGGGPVLEPVKSQCYNNLAHYTRHSARHHIAQRGAYSATVAGAFAESAKTKATASTLYQATTASDPHADLEGQMKRAPQTYLRFENVYKVHLQRVKPEMRRGDHFYLKAVVPLSAACIHPTVLDAIKRASKVVRPGFFPQIMLWTLYPLRVGLDLLWRKVAPTLAPGSSNKPNAVEVELISVFERLINFGHTGAMKVMATGVMDRLWPSRAILDTGYPAFSPALNFGGEDGLMPSMSVDHWPRNPATNYPLVSSRFATTLFDVKIIAVIIAFALSSTTTQADHHLDVLGRPPSGRPPGGRCDVTQSHHTYSKMSSN
ncbi:hypothetical protein ACG7TL_007384 [Trametes sanguinea]